MNCAEEANPGFDGNSEVSGGEEKKAVYPSPQIDHVFQCGKMYVVDNGLEIRVKAGYQCLPKTVPICAFY